MPMMEFARVGSRREDAFYRGRTRTSDNLTNQEFSQPTMLLRNESISGPCERRVAGDDPEEPDLLTNRSARTRAERILDRRPDGFESSISRPAGTLARVSMNEADIESRRISADGIGG